MDTTGQQLCSLIEQRRSRALLYHSCYHRQTVEEQQGTLEEEPAAVGGRATLE